MSSPSHLDELSRAAAAAGFAMATPDDDTAVAVSHTSVAPRASAEDLARGGIRSSVAERQALVPAVRAAAPAAPKGFLAGANTVREAVYGYLRFGVPA